jgi:hypothetical protein
LLSQTTGAEPSPVLIHPRLLHADAAVVPLWPGQKGERMPNGRDAYSVRAANLVQEIANLSSEKGNRERADLLFTEYNEFNKPDVR